MHIDLVALQPILCAFMALMIGAIDAFRKADAEAAHVPQYDRKKRG